MTVDIDALEAATNAYASSKGSVHSAEFLAAWMDYLNAANPATILALIQRVRDAEAALRECEEFCDNRADAETFSDGTIVANDEMRLLVTIRAALAAAPKDRP